LCKVQAAGLRSLVYHQQSAIYCHQDFLAGTHSDFFQGQSDRGLFHLPNHSGETQLSKQEEQGCKQFMQLAIFIEKNAHQDLQNFHFECV
jgi:hypothetical protein